MPLDRVSAQLQWPHHRGTHPGTLMLGDRSWIIRASGNGARPMALKRARCAKRAEQETSASRAAALEVDDRHGGQREPALEAFRCLLRDEDPTGLALRFE